MKARPLVWKETGAVALGQLICCGIMVAVFYLLGKFTAAVILGALAGLLLATANFFVMALCADIAADRSENQEVRSGQALIQTSYFGRMLALFLILILLAKTGVFHLVALALPLAFVRPILSVKAFIIKKGGNTQ